MGRVDTFIVNVEIVVVRDDRFLMIVRADGLFGAGWLTFPGGKLEWDGPAMDALEATARRELREEVGMELEPPVLFVEGHTFEANGAPVLDVVMLARAGEGEPSVAAPAEVADVIWLTAEEILVDPRVQPWTRTSLQRALARRHLLVEDTASPR